MAQSSMSRPASTAPTSAALDSLPDERWCARASPRRVALVPGVGIPLCAAVPPAAAGAAGVEAPEPLAVPVGWAVCEAALGGVAVDGVVLVALAEVVLDGGT